MDQDLIFFFDLDGTLKTPNFHDKHITFPQPHLTVRSGKKEYAMVKRPHVDEMLTTAKQKGRVFLSTAAGGGYARKVLEALEITNYFDQIISAENFMRGLKCYTNCIFIDDDLEMVKLKMAKMAPCRQVIRQDYWVVNPYQGNAEDTVCLEIIEEINGL